VVAEVLGLSLWNESSQQRVAPARSTRAGWRLGPPEIVRVSAELVVRGGVRDRRSIAIGKLSIGLIEGQQGSKGWTKCQTGHAHWFYENLTAAGKSSHW
jgi:hypothetical protein